MNNTTFGQGWIPFDMFKAIKISEGCVVTAANAIAIIVLLRKSFRTKTSTFFVLSMTLADLQVGIAGILYYLDIVNSFWLDVTLPASLLSLTGVAVERAYAVFFPFKHRSSRTRTYVIWIALLWTWSLASLFLRVLKSFNFYRIPVFTVCSAVIIICYVSIWIKMKFGKTFDNERASRNNAKLAKTLSIVASTTFVCYLPYVISLAIDVSGISSCVLPLIINVFQMLLLSNSFWNVLVYSIRMPEFRKELRDIVRQCAICRRIRLYQHDRSRDTPTQRDNMSRDNPVNVLGDLASRDKSTERSNMSRDNPVNVLDDLASRDTSAEIGNMSRENPACVLGDLASRDHSTKRGNVSRDSPACVLGDLASRDHSAERGNKSRDNPVIVSSQLASRDTVICDQESRDQPNAQTTEQVSGCGSICVGNQLPQMTMTLLTDN
ncbi:predicted protein [Nematostella vectensis]|uniref:G-protein coupled receptors family 1 profile domain-containing protein n=1 Tax=Nematostella vectensis TaxID=45351 RepID=A7SH88_NEMVE|nr:uncharacterized protein LOC125570188 [Nematostella vectensis]EDO36937.1 predicted protein [Nematostella vectensis]|eukprot:XP_001629000.1 predicted protein [Nematostella vectensis]